MGLNLSLTPFILKKAGFSGEILRNSKPNLKRYQHKIYEKMEQYPIAELLGRNCQVAIPQ